MSGQQAEGTRWVQVGCHCDTSLCSGVRPGLGNGQPDNMERHSCDERRDFFFLIKNFFLNYCVHCAMRGTQ